MATTVVETPGGGTPAGEEPRVDTFESLVSEAFEAEIAPRGPEGDDGSVGDDDALQPPVDLGQPADQTPPAATPAPDAAQQQPAQPDEVIARWAQTLIESPQRVSEVPRRHLADVFEATIQSVAMGIVSEAEGYAAQIQDAAYRAGFEAGRADVGNQLSDAELAHLQENDPVAFAKAAKEQPARVRAFTERQEAAAREASVPAEVRVMMATAKSWLRNNVPDELRDTVKEALAQKRGAFPPTPEGFEALQREVNAILEAHRPGNAQPPAAAAPPQADRHPREVAAERRASVPRTGGQEPATKVADAPREVFSYTDARDLAFEEEYGKRRR